MCLKGRPADLSVIIVTCNSEQVLGKCLGGIGSAYADAVIVFDNASQDNTLRVGREYGVSILESHENIGFGAAANIAAKQSNARYLCFLNPDCVPSPELFREALRAMAESYSLCAVPNFIEGDHIRAGRQPGYTRLKLISDVLESNYGDNFFSRRIRCHPNYDDDSWCWPHGACMFVLREDFMRTGGFDTRFFMYMEDVDFGRRFAESGGKIIQLKYSLVHHVAHGATISQRRHMTLLNTGRLRYAKLCYGLFFAAFLSLLLLPKRAFNLLRWEV